MPATGPTRRAPDHGTDPRTAPDPARAPDPGTAPEPARAPDPGTAPDAWWRYGVVYQVYPRSFQDTDGDGIGDLPGVIERLDHLNDGTERSLGVGAIWLSPFYPSPMADFGYDIADYCDVDPMFGTLADFDRFVSEAHGRGIRIVIDYVPNHTSDRHPWFEESRSSRSSPKRDWYVWRDPKPDGSPPNNWRSAFETIQKSAWTLDPATGQFYLHSFLPQQPDLNWWNAEVRKAMTDVLRFWLDRGVDGFRIDVAHKMAFDPELADNVEPETGGIVERHDEDWPAVHEIHREFRSLLESYGPERMSVGEVYLFDPQRLASYFGTGRDELHLAFNFMFLRNPWQASAFRESVEAFEDLLPAGAWPDYVLGNHDHQRIASKYDEDHRGHVRARVAATMLLTLRGTPFVYQGEEIGMRDGPVPPERVVDVHGRDPERTPMQWARGGGAGFTTGEPWLPISPEADTVNVEDERDDPRSTFSLYRRLIWFRRRSAALRWGAYRTIDAGDPDVFAYERSADGERLLVLLSFVDRPIRLDLGGLDGSAEAVMSTDPERPAGEAVDLSSVDLRPDEGRLLRLAEARE